MSARTRLGHAAAKSLGIKLNYREYGSSPPKQEDLSRGESVFSVDTADAYVEEEPTVIEWLSSIAPTGRNIALYLYHLFPFVHWIHRYNLQWLYGDLIAGTLSTLPL